MKNLLSLSKIFWFVIVCVFAVNTCLSQELIHVNSKQKEYVVSPKVSVWNDTQSRWLQEGLVKAIQGATFKPYKRNFFVHNTSKSVLIKLNLQYDCESVEDFLFELKNPDLDRIQLALFEKDSLVFLSKKIGDVYPFNKRYLDSKQFVIPVTFKPKTSYTIYVAINKEYRIITSQLMLTQQAHWDANQRVENLFLGITLGSFVGFILVSILLFLMIRKRMYLYYGFYASMIFLLLLGIHGYAYKYIFPTSPEFQFLFITSVQILGLLFLNLYAFNFLELEELFKRFKYIRMAYVSMYLLALFSTIFHLDQQHALLSKILNLLFFLVQVSNFMLLLVVPIWMYRKYKEIAGLIFFISFLCVGLSLLYTNLSFWNDSMYYIPLTSSLPIGLFLEMLVLSTYMIYSYKTKENLRLETEIALQQARLDNQAAFLVGQEEENKKIAYYLHDEIGSSTVFIKKQLEDISNEDFQAKKRDVLESVSGLAQKIRMISHELLPLSLEEHGLNAAIKELINRLNSENLNIHYSDLDVKDFGSVLNLQVYRIIQELLKNTIQHAHASNIYIQFFEDEENKSTTLMYEDDGKGLDLKALNHGLGMKSILTRCELIQAKHTLESSPDAGFSVYITFNIQ